jgi:peptide/nickel transport system ATP-binding protein
MSTASEGSLRDATSRDQHAAGVKTKPLVVSGLRVDAPNGKPIVQDVSFELEPGTILGVVGESGSGKTTVALALLGYTQRGARISAGEISIAGERIDVTDAKAIRRLRGRSISYVPQNPGTSLNPATRIRAAIEEMIRIHRNGGPTEGEIDLVLDRMALPGTEDFKRRYPHQLSGGQQQRVCISISLVCEPPIVVLDEPTTGLDVVSQARILDELVRLCQEQGLAMVYVTHDLAVVAQIADRIVVMYAGDVVEQGPARDILSSPNHPYTRGLLRSVPDHLRPGALEPMPGAATSLDERPAGCCFAPRCSLTIPECAAEVPALLTVGDGHHEARCIRPGELGGPLLDIGPVAAPAPARSGARQPVLEVHNLRAEHHGRHGTVVAASDVSFAIGEGECAALVGESGSGKTTIARTIAGLHPVGGGSVTLRGEQLPAHARKRSQEIRREIQLVFQNPADALNPRQTIGQVISRPARLLRGLSKTEAQAEVKRLLDLVRLPPSAAGRYPADLSGGEQQRVGIARALAADPSVIVCDEITSALDVSVQAAVLQLLGELRQEFGLALLFITHDLGVVANIADQVLVLEKGLVVEQGMTASVLSSPQRPYTRRLLEAAPSVSHALDLWNQEQLQQ